MANRQSQWGQIGVYRSAGITLTDGQWAGLPLGSDGKLLVDANLTLTEVTVGDVAAGTDTGQVLLGVRDDATSTVTESEGEYTPLRTNARGAAWVALETQLDRAQDNVGVAHQTDVIMNDTTALTPKFAAINASSSGDNTLVAAVASKNIRVLSLFLVVTAEVTVRFEDGAGGTALSGLMTITDHSGLVLPFNPVGWFQTSDNTLLNLELGGAVQVSGSLTYVEV